MDFITQLKKELDVSVTENGAVGYRTTNHDLLDLNFSVASLRSVSEEEIRRRFSLAYFDDRLLALKWLFFARDVREGLGERRLFRVCLKWIAESDPDVAKKVLPLVAEYGRWDDLWPLLETDICGCVTALALEQVSLDIEGMNRNKPISLLGKWLPSVNASSETTKRYARIILRKWRFKQGDYRLLCRDLRAYLKVVETQMSEKRWGEIDYSAVPSRANLVYNKAFLRNDEERRRAFLDSLKKGETKINAGVLFPHDIVHRYGESVEFGRRNSLCVNDTLEELWKALPDMVNGAGNTIVVADGSGSMMCKVGNTGTTALDVANALAIYFSERSSGEFKDKYITFSGRPQLVDLGSGETLRDRILIALSHSECANTNIKAIFDLILATAVNAKMKQNEMPENVLIISDMEFDSCATVSESGGWFSSIVRPTRALFEEISEQYAEFGYQLPRLVFWNVNSRTGTIPVKENDLGVALVSGFSPNICKMVMSGKTDPWECLLETLESERYLPIENAFKEATGK